MPNDNQYYYGLAHARGRQRELNEFETATKDTVKPPSKLKYGGLFALAGFADIVDLAELTGIGIILAWAVKLIVSPILFFAGFGANARVKAMSQFQESVGANIAELTQRAQTYARRYTAAIKFSRKTGILKKPVKRMALKVAKARKAVMRNPAVKNGVAVVVDLVPLLDLLPWRTIGIYLAYRDEKKTYLETQEVIPEYYAAKVEEMRASNDLQESEMAEQTA